MAQKIVFFGNERLATGVTTAAPTLSALVAAGYEVAAVVVAQNHAGKSRQGRDLEVAVVTNHHNIPLLAPRHLSDITDELKEYGAEAAVLIAFGKLIPEEILNVFPKGIINVHPSLLPKHRGPTPIESVIADGDEKTGVSLIKLIPKMDAGPIYAQQTVELHGDESKQQLADQLSGIGKAMLLEHLPAILDGSLKPEDQKELEATFDKKLEKSATQLDFLRKPADRLAREVRAYIGWPRSRARLGTAEIIITEAHAIEAGGTAGTLFLDGHTLGLHAKEGTLIIDKLIPPGRKEMTAAAYLAGNVTF